MVKEKKGLKAIFGEELEGILEEIEGGTSKEGKELSSIEIEIKNIVANPYQPRKNFDDSKLKELSLSIKEHGVFTPIIVKKAPVGKYYLIVGERRLRASKIANLKTIPAIVKEMTDQQMQEIALLENIQREDLNPIEEALSYNSILKKYKISQEEFANRIGKSRTHVTNILRLLTLPEKIIKYVTIGELTFGHVRPLVGLNEELALKIAQRAFSEKLNVRQVENIVSGYKLGQTTKKHNPKKSQDIKYVESLLRKKLKINAKLNNNKIILPFKNNEHLNQILSILGILDDE